MALTGNTTPVTQLPEQTGPAVPGHRGPGPPIAVPLRLPVIFEGYDLRSWIVAAVVSWSWLLAGCAGPRVLMPTPVRYQEPAASPIFESTPAERRTSEIRLFYGTNRVVRWIFAAAMLAGWLVGALTQVHPVTVGLWSAFVGGGIIITAIREELPSEGDTRFLPFLAGVVGATVLLLAVERMPKP